MGRPHHATERERQFVKGMVEGKNKKQAAIDAGYAPSTAHHSARAILNRPLVRSELTRALEAAGITFQKIIQPYIDGLTAVNVVKNTHTLEGKETTVPDLGTRMFAADRIVDLFGGVPKVGETTPS